MTPILLVPAGILVAMVLTSRMRSWGLLLLLLAIYLSPRFAVGALSGGKTIDLRLEDILLAFLLLAWVMRSAGEVTLRLPMGRRLFLYLQLAVLSTGVGALLGWIDPPSGILYFLKEVEYFLILLIVSAHISSLRQVKGFVAAMLVLGLVDLGWKVTQLATGVSFLGYGPDSLFEEYAGVQSAAAALFPLSVALGLLVSSSSPSRWRYLALASLFSASLIMTAKRSFLAALVIGLAISPTVMWNRRRVVGLSVLGFAAIAVGLFGVTQLFPDLSSVGRLIDPRDYLLSGAERVSIWIASLDSTFLKNPLMGIGKGSFPSAGATHNFYVRLLCDGGVIGLGAFLWFWTGLWRHLRSSLRQPGGGVVEGVVWAWVFATIFLAIANFFGEYMLTVRPAETYWFLTGVAVAAVRLRSSHDVTPEGPPPDWQPVGRPDAEPMTAVGV